jgi:hypothetical protein
MTKFKPGDPVTVEFRGIKCDGIVIRQSSITGFVMARIAIPDVEVDFGSISPQLDPQPTVCVAESKVALHSVAPPP